MAGSGMGGWGREGKVRGRVGANRGFVYIPPLTICFHAYAFTSKWEGPVADYYWSCRQWQRQAGLRNRLCLNLRICSSSCLHNEVKWSEEMLGWPWPKRSTPDVLLTVLAWVCPGPQHCKLQLCKVQLLIYNLQTIFRVCSQIYSMSDKSALHQ